MQKSKYFIYFIDTLKVVVFIKKKVLCLFKQSYSNDLDKIFK